MDTSRINKNVPEDFKKQYNNAKHMAVSSLDKSENIVLLGNNGVNGKSFLMNELNPKNYTTLYGLQEVNSKTILKEKPFILETNNKADLKKLDSFEIPYKLIDMPISITSFLESKYK